MDNRHFEADAIDSAPDLNTLKSKGYPTDGNPELGIPATLPGAAWFYSIGEEIRNVILKGGVTPDHLKVNQMAEAIEEIVANAIKEIDYTDFVKTTGNQTIEGIKTFIEAVAKADQDTSLADLTYATAKFVRAICGVKNAANTWTNTNTFNKASTFNEVATFKKAVTGVSATADSHFVIKSQLDDAIKNGTTVPTGTIIAYAGKTTPSGFLIANGAAVSRTTYANLFTAIGTIYGAGDGKTTFNLPNPRNRHLYGANSTSEVGQKLEAGLPNIIGQTKYLNGVPTDITEEKGQISDSGALYTKELSYGVQSRNNSFPHSTNINIDAKRSNALYGKASTVQVSSIKILFLIKS